jgi:hypothetical protein
MELGEKTIVSDWFHGGPGAPRESREALFNALF